MTAFNPSHDLSDVRYVVISRLVSGLDSIYQFTYFFLKGGDKNISIKTLEVRDTAHPFTSVNNTKPKELYDGLISAGYKEYKTKFGSILLVHPRMDVSETGIELE